MEKVGDTDTERGRENFSRGRFKIKITVEKCVEQ